MKLLNLGCGHRFHDSFTNLDFVPATPDVIQCDLRKGIPFPDQSFDVVYHSHVLEHFSKEAGKGFLRECHRVLNKSGILRVAVPNLEEIAKLYLEKLNSIMEGHEEDEGLYEWMTIEMYDQTVRESSGGQHSRFVHTKGLANRDFLIGRMGGEISETLSSLENNKNERPQSPEPIKNHNRWTRRLETLSNRSLIKQAILRRILGPEDYENLILGRFRRSGEIHLWMYDRYSLPKTLLDIGFQRVQAMTHNKSNIPDWEDYHLDTEAGGAPYKPDSLYVEAVKGSL